MCRIQLPLINSNSVESEREDVEQVRLRAQEFDEFDIEFEARPLIWAPPIVDTRRAQAFDATDTFAAPPIADTVDTAPLTLDMRRAWDTTINHVERVVDTTAETMRMLSYQSLAEEDSSSDESLWNVGSVVRSLEDRVIPSVTQTTAFPLVVGEASSLNEGSLGDRGIPSHEISRTRSRNTRIMCIPRLMVICDYCKDMTKLMYSYASRVGLLCKGRSHDSADIEDLDEVFSHNFKVLWKDEVSRFKIFLWEFFEKPCDCCCNDETYDRLKSFTESLIRLVIKQLYVFKYQINYLRNNEFPPFPLKENRWIPDDSDESDIESEEQWTFEQVATLFQIMLKVFVLSDPLLSRPRLLNEGRSRTFSQFCDHTIKRFESKYVRQNVDLFCRLRGIQLISDCLDCEYLPISVAFPLMSIGWSLQEWLNTSSLITLFLPLRSKILRYLCNIEDESYSTTLFMKQTKAAWEFVNDSTRIPLIFDKDGLDLAFRCLTSSTLTTQLAGLTQINFYIETFKDVGNLELAAWLVHNKIIAQIFSPDMLVVEIIEQSHIILNFLALENKITNDDIDIIWRAAKLVRCSPQVFNLLDSLTENLASAPITHLSLLINHDMKMDSKTEPFTCRSGRSNYTYLADKTYAFIVMREQSNFKEKQDCESTSTNMDSGFDSDATNEDVSPRKRTNLIGTRPPEKLRKYYSLLSL